MFITKRESWPVGLILLGAALALTFGFTLALRADAAVSCTFSSNLYMGVRNDRVKCLQQYLNSAGFIVASSGAGSMDNETTYFGGRTKAAVAKWQAANNVSPTKGYFGAISRAKYVAMASGVVMPPGVMPPGVMPPGVVGNTVSVSLSATTPAARTIVAGAANMSFGRWDFTAGSGGDVMVTTIKFTRSGISSDAELGSAYLYDADSGAYLSQYSGLGSGVLTFTNSSGLFTVKSGMVKHVELRLDVSSSASNNHTMGWSINAATDIVSSATQASTIFPLIGNAMTFVTVSNPAIATLTSTVVTTGNSVNAGTTGYLAGSFTLQSANSAVLLDRIVLTQNGSLISTTDVGNIKLVTTGGQQLGQVLPNLNGNGTGVFVMSPAYLIPAGQTIQVNVYADILAGVNRTLAFNVLNLRDVQARDNTYNVGINPSGSVTMTSTTVQAGTLTVTLDPSSPTGNLAPGQTNVTVGKFKVVSYGEQVKVLFVPFKVLVASNVPSTHVANVYLVDDAGNQIGTTITTAAATATDGTTWSSTATGGTTNGNDVAATFGTSSSNINYLIPANTTRIWSLKMDVKSTATGTIAGSLNAGTSNYQGQVSLSSAGTTAVTANTLTVQSNAFQGKLNNALGTGNLVKGQGSAKIASYVLSASSAEGINISTLTLTSSSTFPFANLLVKVNGVQFGNVTGSVAASTNYTFAGASPANIPLGSAITVDVYADVLSTATNLGSSFYVQLTGASAVGAVTASTQTLKDTSATAISTANAINSQFFTINVAGPTITLNSDASKPAAYQVSMGKTQQTIGIWRINGGTTEDANITELTIKDKVGASGNKSSFQNLQWYKGGVAFGPVVVAGTASGTAGSETGYSYLFTFASPFASPVVVPANSGISLELRGDVTTFASGGATSNSTHTFTFNPSGAYLLARGAGSSLTAVVNDSGSVALGTASTFAGSANTTTDVNAVTVARTKLTVTSDPTGILTTGHPVSSADIMAVFVFTADSAYDVTISTVTLKLAGSTLTTINVQLIDDSTGLAWGSTPTAYTTVFGQGGPTTGTASTSIAFFPSYTLTAGATKRVRVVADTTGSQSVSDIAFTPTNASINGTLAQWIIGNDTTGSNGSVLYNALCWGDGTTACTAAGGAFNLESKILPIYGPSIRY